MVVHQAKKTRPFVGFFKGTLIVRFFEQGKDLMVLKRFSMGKNSYGLELVVWFFTGQTIICVLNGPKTV